MKGHIPEVLPENEINNLFEEYKNGSEKAREKIINHNIRLVGYIVNRYFKTVPFDYDDIESIGLSGLIKAVDSFDIDKNIKFGTFAARVIYNEIGMFLRKEKGKNDVSLEDTIYANKDGDEIALGDTISDEKDSFIEKLDNDEALEIVRNYVLNMEESKEKQCIMLYFGFNCKVHKQQEIADILGWTQSYVSRILEKTVKRIGNELKETGVINKVETKKDKKINSKNLLNGKGNGKKHSYKQENLEIIKEFVLGMPDSREKKMIIMYFGFGDKLYTQVEISSIFGIHKTTISSLIKKEVKKIDIKLQEMNIRGVNGGNISLSYFKDILNKEKKLKGYRGQNLSTIYELLKTDDRDLVKEVIDSLNENDRDLFERRNGKDLDNPILDSNWCTEDGLKFNRSLIPKMRNLLEKQKNNRNGTMIDITRTGDEKEVFPKQNVILKNQESFPICERLEKDDKNNAKEKDVNDNMNNIDELTKGNDGFNVVKDFILNAPDFTEKQALVMYLGLDGKVYKQKEIAERFGYSTSYISQMISNFSAVIDAKLRRNNIKDKEGNYITVSDFKQFLSKKNIKLICSEVKPSITDETLKNEIKNVQKEELSSYVTIDLSKEDKKENIIFPLDKCIGEGGTHLPDLDKFLENISIPRFELFIVSLKLGLLPNGKKYTTDEIANFLDISKKDVIEIVKKILILYKQQLNSLIDKLIDEEQIHKK